MVPGSFHDFFMASGGASAALVGLLFVAVSISRDSSVGRARVTDQIRASSALTGFVAPLIMSLVALIPGAGLGITSIVVGAVGLVYVGSALRTILTTPISGRERGRTLIALAGYVVVLGIDAALGITLVISPSATGAVSGIAGAIVASLAIGVDRSWELVGERAQRVSASMAALFGGKSPLSPRESGTVSDVAIDVASGIAAEPEPEPESPSPERSPDGSDDSASG